MAIGHYFRNVESVKEENATAPLSAIATAYMSFPLGPEGTELGSLSSWVCAGFAPCHSEAKMLTVLSPLLGAWWTVHPTSGGVLERSIPEALCVFVHSCVCV